MGSVRIVGEEMRRGIPVREMKDGQIGRIVEWGAGTNRRGALIRRIGVMFVSLGAGIFWSNLEQDDAFRVEIVPNGTRLEVVDNE